MADEQFTYRPYGDCTTQDDIDRWWEIFHRHGGMQHEDVHLSSDEWRSVFALVESLILDAGDLSIEAELFRREVEDRDRPWWKRLLGVRP